MRESASTDLREPQGSNPLGPPGPELPRRCGSSNPSSRGGRDRAASLGVLPGVCFGYDHRRSWRGRSAELAR